MERNKMENMKPEILTLSEFALYLKIPPCQARKMSAQKTIPGLFKIPGYRRVYVNMTEFWMTIERQKAGRQEREKKPSITKQRFLEIVREARQGK
jgi:hypothetical protein